MTSPDNPVSPAGDAELERGAMARSTLRALQTKPAHNADPAVAPALDPEPVDPEPVEPDAVDLVKAAPDVDPDDDDPPGPGVAAPAGTSTRDPARLPPPARSFPLVGVLAVVTAAALVFAVIAGVVWHNAGHSTSRARAEARDAATLQARLDIEAVNTADYRRAAAAVDSWLSVSTGQLHGDYQSAKASTITLLTQAKVSTSAAVLDAAVVSLNVSKGTAVVIASANVRKMPASGTAVTARNRFKATMKLVNGRWKLADLGLVPVGLS